MGATPAFFGPIAGAGPIVTTLNAHEFCSLSVTMLSSQSVGSLRPVTALCKGRSGAQLAPLRRPSTQVGIARANASAAREFAAAESNAKHYISAFDYNLRSGQRLGFRGGTLVDFLSDVTESSSLKPFVDLAVNSEAWERPTMQQSKSQTTLLPNLELDAAREWRSLRLQGPIRIRKNTEKSRMNFALPPFRQGRGRY